MISVLLPRKRNFDTHHAADSPKAALIGTTIAATVSVSAIAARASGIPECAQVAAETFARGFDSDDDQRGKEKQAEEPDREGDQRQPGKRRLGGSGRLGANGGRGVRHDPRLRRVQPCARLMTNNMTKDSASMIAAIAVAPA